MGNEAGEELPIVNVVEFQADMRGSLLKAVRKPRDGRNAEQMLTGACSQFLVVEIRLKITGTCEFSYTYYQRSCVHR